MQAWRCRVVRKDLGLEAVVVLPITPQNLARGAELWNLAVVLLDDEQVSRDAVVQFFGKGAGK
jgi:hypothetical protein